MSRLNGRVHHTGASNTPPVLYQAQYGGQGLPPQYPDAPHRDEYEPSCLVRTPSGNVYIPSEERQKNSPMDYKPGIHSPNLHSPIKGDHKTMESYNTHFGPDIGMPVLPLRNNLRRPTSPPSSYDMGVNERGNGGGRTRHPTLHRQGRFSPYCSWRCTAIVFITIAFVLAALLGFFTATSVLYLPTATGGGCGIILDDASSVTDDSKLVSHSPTRGNLRPRESGDEDIMIEYDIPVVLNQSPQFTLLEALGLARPPVKRMRRSVSVYSQRRSMEPDSRVDSVEASQSTILNNTVTSPALANKSILPVALNSNSVLPANISLSGNHSLGTMESILRTYSSLRSQSDATSNFNSIKNHAIGTINNDNSPEQSLSPSKKEDPILSVTKHGKILLFPSENVRPVENKDINPKLNFVRLNIPFANGHSSNGTGNSDEIELSTEKMKLPKSLAIENSSLNFPPGLMSRKPPDYYDSVDDSSKYKLNTASELFPHIFEYDLKEEHEDYYDEENDWFGEFWAEEDGRLLLKEKPSSSLEKDLVPKSRLMESRLPDEVKVMALTREQFHIDTPAEPRVVFVNGTPLPNELPSKLYNYNDEVEIITLGESTKNDPPPLIKIVYDKQMDPRKIIHNTANDVYVHSTEIPGNVSGSSVELNETVSSDFRNKNNVSTVKAEVNNLTVVLSHSEAAPVVINTDLDYLENVTIKETTVEDGNGTLLKNSNALHVKESLNSNSGNVIFDARKVNDSVRFIDRNISDSLNSDARNVSESVIFDARKVNDSVKFIDRNNSDSLNSDARNVSQSESSDARNISESNFDAKNVSEFEKSDGGNVIESLKSDINKSENVDIRNVIESETVGHTIVSQSENFVNKNFTDSTNGDGRNITKSMNQGLQSSPFSNVEVVTMNGNHQIISHDNGRHPKRVTVNVTIATEEADSDGEKTNNVDKPVYVLSVSVPTSGKSEETQINILNPQFTSIGNISLPKLYDVRHSFPDVAVEVNKFTEPEITEGRNSSSTEALPPPCLCEKNDDVKAFEKLVNLNNETLELFGNFSKVEVLINATYNNFNWSSVDEHFEDGATGCVIVIEKETCSPTTTVTEPLPPDFDYELREHQQRPYQTIPPDGTTFKMVELGHKLKHKIPPYGYWNMQFYQPESAYVKFEVGVPRGASLGIYARRNALPTHTSYDFLQVLSGYKVGTASRNTRASSVASQLETLVKYLDQGHWFLSVYNDDGDPQELSLGAHVSSEYTEGCPNGCSSSGDCILGSCQCYPGFAGHDCTELKCPVLCSGNGEYREGHCVCRPGWKGKECSLRHDECEVPDCSGHGHCVDGRCLCAKGFKGNFCEDVDCPHPLCSGKGWCVNGTCICQKGWRAPDCSTMDDTALQCLPDCSGHGHFDLVGQQCVCEPEWTGSECNGKVCGLDCGLHGRCEGGKCLCSEGWTGSRCDLLICDARCEKHGQCKNGTCICMTGWNGRHCTLTGCPGSCFNHGSCVLAEEEWSCSCYDGWEGPDCSQRLEDRCDDGVDNDNDGLTDCADAECCSAPPCTHSTLCKSSVDPIDILLRKQPPAVTASFFQKMRFIVEENSVQVYADPNAFNQSRASVVRGRLVSGRGSGLVGVRVSHFRPKNTGFTLSRQGGWFDLMVNGGGAVKLHFGKSQFLPVTKTVWVPWNEIVVINTVVMTTSEVVPPPLPRSCPDHDYATLKPVVLATWKHGFQGGCPQCSAILTESQVVQESLPVPGTGLHLVYHSSRALGYESTIQLQLTPSVIPASLSRIYLKITVEGILFEKTFEADADIKFTYAWNRLNVYRQRVYGVTWAVVKVGYAYTSCDQIIWDSQSTQVSGHDMSVSDIGKWDLSIHHRYNFHEGILQKGDGSNVYLKQRPPILKILMGDGRQRELNCQSCEGAVAKQRLLTPASLASGPDGSLYIADFNLIRRILPDNSVKTVVKLNETRVSYRYHLAISPVDGAVYISDPEAHQILKMKDPFDPSKAEDNVISYVGSGERCLPGDDIGCGDGGLARDAKLQYPKGMAVSSDEVLYFADGTNVRAVDADGIISTVIGTHQHRSHWQPLPCAGTLSVSDVSLRWPISLAINPLDESLYVLDDHHILRLTKDGRIKIVAGRPLHCPQFGKDGLTELAAQTTLRSPQSLAFTPSGDLYIVESDTERINRIRMITTDERIHDFAGAESKCNCRDDSCKCFDESHVLAATAIFSTISAIAVTPDGAVHVLDQGNLRIRSVVASIPEPTKSRDYEIYSPETQEMYIFNRFGHHIETRNIPTKRSLYTFIYNVNTSNGKLSSVTDAAGNKINFLRDYTGQVTMIENSRQQKSRLKMSRMRRLEEMVTPDEHNVTLTYHGATGLLRSRMDSSGRAHVYTYDRYGRLTRTVTPSGQIIDLSFDLSQAGARVTVTRGGVSPVTMLIKGSSVAETIGSASSVTAQLPDGSVSFRNAWGHHISTDTVSYELLRDNVLANSFPVPGKQKTEINRELINSFEWKYFSEFGDGQNLKQVGRRMYVNGEPLLTFKYDLLSGTEAVFNKGGNELLNVTYDNLGRPLRWSPPSAFHAVTFTYDRYGLLQEWNWGEEKEDYLYDRAGRFEGIKYADGSKITYSYKDLSSIQPYKVSVEGGMEHLLEYDASGDLASITTPRGFKYTFQLQPSLLHNRFLFSPPGAPHHPYQILYTDDGRLLAKVLPQQAGRIIYSYDEAGRLQHQIFGDGSIEYGYQAETGLIRSVTLRELAYEQRIDNKYHAGLVKEQRIRFGPAVRLNAAKLRYLYDGNARPRRVELEINGQELPDYEMKYDMILGSLENVDDLKITKTYHNKTMIQDSRKTMLRVSHFDEHGRLKEEALTIHGRLVHRLRYSYDLRGRLASKIIWRGVGSLELVSNYSYTRDGYLESVEGAESWQFKYDSNGNMISVVEGGREITSSYDMADRLVTWGEDQLNTFDDAGRVTRQKDAHFSYTARGNIRHSWKQNHFRMTYRCDHRGRLTSIEDHHGNVTQFFYADLMRPNLPTHVHYPGGEVTHTMFYDDLGHLVALQTANGRLWVVTDNVGTPVAVYDSSGILAKEIIRSPWGETLHDSRPQLKLHLDFFGSLRDSVTGLLFFHLDAYDPAHAQWMASRYEAIPNTPQHISSIYLHRFKENNPLNGETRQNHHTDINDWLKLFGVDISRMLGSLYHDETYSDPLSDIQIPNIESSMRLISGLSCSIEGVMKHFSKPSLIPDSLVQLDEPRLATSKWTMLGKFSSTGPVLGPGILVSKVGEKALVTLVPHRENSVVQAVVRDVLNGSSLLDVTLPHHRHHTLYLLKKDASTKAEDLEQLQRLSGLFNITSHDGEHPEIRVVGPTASLILLYGTTPDAARHKLLKHVHHRAAEHAWQIEKGLLESGGPSLHPWTEEEQATLLREGKVRGFVAAELHSVHRFPLLADDASNVVFRRDVDRRRRRSRNS